MTGRPLRGAVHSEQNMALDDTYRPKCEIEADGCVPLSSILRAFNAPIGEEQAWALCFQTAKCMSKEWSADSSGCYALTDISQLRIHKDGSVHCSTVRCLGTSSTRTIATTEYKLVCSLGLVLFKAVEYGLRPDEDHELSRGFEIIIDRMTSADPTSGSPSLQPQDDPLSSDDDSSSGEDDCHDEGIEKDSGEDDPGGGDVSSPGHKEGLTLSRVIEMCASRLQFPAQADAHYKAVCRALVAEALELSTFLQTVSKTTKDLITDSDPNWTEHSNLDDLQFKDWARLWMQVIWELRRDVKLKKVDVETHLHPVEYELTPYEMLLDDIRSRRYKLNKVMVNGNLPPRVKKDAHALILDFIRSRPPLRPASSRKLKPAPSPLATAYDKLMASIRQPQTLRPVQRTCGSVETSRTKLVENDSTPEPRKRLIAPNISLRLSTNFDEDDPDDAPPSPTTEQPYSLPVQLTQPLQRPNRLALQNKRSSSSIDNPTTATLKQKLERRHSITVCESPGKPPRAAFCRGNTVATSACMPADGSSSGAGRNESSGTRKDKWTLAQWEKSMECLSLTLEEVVHIRNVLTKAELETLLVNRPLYDEVEKRKVCFTCKKTRFSFFRPWGVKCKLCERTICEKCSTKMHIPTDRFDRIPVYMLSPSASSSEEDAPSHSEQRMPTVFQLTSGSAPSSPTLGRPPAHTSSGTVAPKISTRFNVPVYPPPNTLTPWTTGVPKLRHCKSMRAPSVQEEPSPTISRGRPPLLRSCTFVHKPSSHEEHQLRGPLVTVCRDCKGMIRHIILAGRTAMAKSQRRMPANWRSNTLCLSPVTQSPAATPVKCQ